MMIDDQTGDNWIQGYLKAWNSNTPEDIGALFTEDANYFTAPFRQPWQGRRAIIDEWLGRKDEPGSFRFRYQILGIDGQRLFVRGWTEYLEPRREYSNLWVIDFAGDGRCSQFIEWWMEHR